MAKWTHWKSMLSEAYDSLGTSTRDMSTTAVHIERSCHHITLEPSNMSNMPGKILHKHHLLTLTSTKVGLHCIRIDDGVHSFWRVPGIGGPEGGVE